MVPDVDVPLTWGAQLAHAERMLAERADATAREEALTLLGSLLGEPMTLVQARPSTPMRPPDVATYTGWIARRLAGEAIPHITGHLAFMGLDLTVAHDSPLVSPAAQLLVEVALECARSRVSGTTSGELFGAEIGAGCGAVALALVTFEPRFARIFAVDPSPDALRVAAANGGRYLVNLVVDWREGEGLSAVPEPVDIIVCDLAAQSARHSSAQNADASGSRASAAPSPLAPLLAQAPAKLRSGGALVCALNGGLEAEARESLAHALPAAHIWTAPSSGGLFVAVAQSPRALSDQARDVTFERGR